MLGMFVWWGIALLVACVVFVYAGTVAGMESGREGRGVRGFFDDVRGAIQSVRDRRAERREHRRDGTSAPAEPDQSAVDTPMGDFFAATQESGPAYMDATDVSESWARTGARAAAAARNARGHVRLGTVRPRHEPADSEDSSQV